MLIVSNRATGRPWAAILGALFAASLALLLPAPRAVAQEATPPDAESSGADSGDADAAFDEEALFGSVDDLFDEESSGIDSLEDSSAGGSAASTEAADPLQTFLADTGTKIGGSLTAKLGASWTWTDPWDGSFNGIEPDSSVLTPSLSSRLIVTARPDINTRYHIALDLEAPFVYQTGVDGLTSDTTGYINPLAPDDFIANDTNLATINTPNISVFELFADRTWGDHLRMRFGKHTVSWGVGYFFSPADVINLGRIDVLDPTAQREGPVNLRVNIPFGSHHQNIWLYAVVPDGRTLEDFAALSPADLAVAGKFEFLAGGFELGAGGYWQRDRAPRAVLTATGALGRFNLFGEAVTSWGSDSVFYGVNENYDESDPYSGPPLLPQGRDKDGLYFKGTLGFMWMGMDSELTIAGQYYYNGEGYEGVARNDLIDAALLRASGIPGGSQGVGYLLSGASRHYGAFSISKSKFFAVDLSVSLFAIANLADLSGMARPSISYEFFEGFSMSLSPSFIWAVDALWGNGENSEYTLVAGGPAMTISVEASLGGGRF